RQAMLERRATGRSWFSWADPLVYQRERPGFMLIVMALTASTMPALGTQAPDFSLPDIISGKTVSLDDVAGPKGVLVMFICGHCPFVVHVQGQLAKLGKDYQDSGIGIVAICSNDEEVSPRDSVENLRKQTETQGFV